MKKIYLILFVFSLHVQAQFPVPKTLDSLNWYLRTQPQDTSYLRAMKDCAFENIMAGNYKRSDSLIRQFEKSGNEKKYIKTAYYVNLVRGTLATYEKGDQTASLNYFLNTLQEAEKHKLDYLLVGALSNVSGQYRKLNDMENAMKYALRAVQLIEQKKAEPLASAYSSVANILLTQKRYTEALTYFQKAYIIDSLQNNRRGMAISDNRMGIAYDDTEQPRTALRYYLRGIQTAEAIGFDLLVCDFAINIGMVYQDEKKYRLAETYFLRAEQLSRKLDSKPSLKISLHNLGELYREENQFNKALPYYLQALEIANGSDELKSKYTAHQALAEYYEDVADYKNAYSFVKKANILKDSLYKTETDATTQEMLNKYQTEKKQQQIVLLEKENENKNLLLENEKRNRFLLFGFLISSILIAGLLYRSYRIKQKSNQALGEKNEELSALNEELNLINERLDEANRTKSKLFSIISHDLRSPVSQLITYLNLQKENPDLLEKHTQQNFEQDLRQSSENLLFTLEDILSWSKSQLEQFSLFSEEVQAPVFFKEVLDFHRRTAEEKQVRLVADFAEDLTFRTDPNFLKVVLRNLLANAVKFTPPGGSVSLSATQEAQTLRIAVADTGKGMIESELDGLFSENITSSASGWGLKITKEFVQKLGGSLSVRSQPGQGTIFEVEIPA
jgi:signal transduction histidine kinase/tetratricopeptide (TPR) repeat protein